MPYRIRHIYPWQGRERDVIEFEELTPLQCHLGMKESFESPDIETLRREEDLAEAGKIAAEQRAEPGEAIITRGELQEHQRQARERLGTLEAGYFT